VRWLIFFHVRTYRTKLTFPRLSYSTPRGKTNSLRCRILYTPGLAHKNSPAMDGWIPYIPGLAHKNRFYWWFPILSIWCQLCACLSKIGRQNVKLDCWDLNARGCRPAHRCLLFCTSGSLFFPPSLYPAFVCSHCQGEIGSIALRNSRPLSGFNTRISKCFGHKEIEGGKIRVPTKGAICSTQYANSWRRCAVALRRQQAGLYVEMRQRRARLAGALERCRCWTSTQKSNTRDLGSSLSTISTISKGRQKLDLSHGQRRRRWDPLSAEMNEDQSHGTDL